MVLSIGLDTGTTYSDPSTADEPTVEWMPLGVKRGGSHTEVVEVRLNADGNHDYRCVPVKEEQA